ncbi:DUF1232 domain-containing protein [Oceanobacillus sp. FSL H7-0719]|uniref:DUF1232 domain-containing protein n=1 Tax=Oceanobacillus sp. FSL H7-0719 TaxID=2954507 RepID=UPI0032484F3B
MKDHGTFRELLNHLIDDKSLSLRKLGRISGIDHATLSKIMNGKRKANLSHLQKLSASLEVELATLMHAAGYTTEIKKEETSEIQDAVKSIQQLIKTTNVYDGDFTIKQIEKEIFSYQNYSQTTEGRDTILQGFEKKVDETASQGRYINQLRMMFSKFSAKNGTAGEIALMGAALIYFIVTTDLIPDYLLPIGFLDDAVIVQTISNYMDNKKLPYL